jgi:hypothetical protein
MRDPLPPRIQTSEADCCRGGHVLQVGLLQTAVAGVSEPTDPDRLRDRPFDAVWMRTNGALPPAEYRRGDSEADTRVAPQVIHPVA